MSNKFSFKQQIDFFKKKINLPTESYRDIWNDEHDYAFMIAGITNMELLGKFKTAIANNLEQGLGYKEFEKQFDKLSKAYAWQYNGEKGWRANVIYTTNMNSSYQAGRYEQMQELKEVMPYWEYIHTPSKHERASHKALHGTILLADHEFWQSHYPPNAYNCNCTVHAHNDFSLKQAGKRVLKDKKIELTPDGTPVNVHPNFNHIPGQKIKNLEKQTQGKSREAIVADLLFERVHNFSPSLASQMVKQLFSFAPAIRVLNKYSNHFVERYFNSKKARGEWLSLGVVREEVISNFKDLKTSVIGLKDDVIIHTQRSIKKKKLPISFFKDLPEKLVNVSYIVKDKEKNNFIFVFKDIGNNEHAKLILEANYFTKLKDIRRTNEKKDYINMFVSGALVENEELEQLIVKKTKGEIIYKKE